MTAKLASELAALIGRQGILETGQEGLRVAVKVREAKSSYGRPRVYVTPLSGNTEQGAWVEVNRIELGASL